MGSVDESFRDVTPDQARAEVRRLFQELSVTTGRTLTEVKEAAILRYGRLAAEPLCEALTDRNLGVRVVASRMLEAIGEPAIPALAELLQGRVWTSAGSTSIRKSVDHDARMRAADILGHIGEPALDSLIPLLGRKEEAILTPATAALAAIQSPRAKEALREFLSERLRREYRARKRLINRKPVRLALLLCGVVALFLVLNAFGAASALGTFGWPIAQGILVATFAVGAADLRRSGIKGIAEAADVRMIDLFALSLDDPDKETREVAREALTRILPKVQASDAEHISPDAYQALLHALNGGKHSLILAILKALEQVGDERALPAVERIAKGHGAGAVRRIQAEAAACLPVLRQRAEAAALAGRLLRPAGPAEEALLRPAGCSSGTEGLLRLPSVSRE